MTHKDTGGPAFPCGESYTTTDLVGNQTKHSKGPLRAGMTLRDYFASKAIAGLLLDDDGDFSDPDWLAEHAYKVADAMLKARETK